MEILDRFFDWSQYILAAIGIYRFVRVFQLSRALKQIRAQEQEYLTKTFELQQERVDNIWGVVVSFILIAVINVVLRFL